MTPVLTCDDWQRLANCVRVLSVDAVESAESGHPGMPLGMADAAAVLFGNHLKFDASAPDWPDRDRFVLSNGHGSMLLYSLLHLTGYPGMTVEELKNFRQWGSRTAGHPERGHAPGIETTTGPLGQGLASAVGMAIAERLLAAEFGSDVVNHRTYVFCGDGCLMEGVGQEAISLAGHLRLGKLIVLYDDNGISIDGPTALSFSENVPAKLRACGWHAIEVDGHDPLAIDAAIVEAKADPRPSMISLKTVIGWGAPTKKGTAAIHGAPLGAAELAATKAALGWTSAPFTVPDDLASAWAEIGHRGHTARLTWEEGLAGLDAARRAELERRLSCALPGDFDERVGEAIDQLIAEPRKIATRKASQIALETLTKALPEMVGGSADLTHSNLTRTVATGTDLTADAAGRYIRFGVREFAMCAAINGINAHGGLVAYGGTFLVFSDYARNAIRLAALMRLPSIFVMTHDSIGLGEDGPTHQPIEHLASLRAMPNLNVFRPADAVETMECYAAALKARATPSLFALSRQTVPQLRLEGTRENLSARGAYVLRETEGPRDVTLIATGTEVALAVRAAEILTADGIAAAVVSMPCWELFDAQDRAYHRRVLGSAPRIAIEAGSRFGWSRYVGSEDHVIGIDTFGASAPAETLYEKFGITTDATVALARSVVRAPATVL